MANRTKGRRKGQAFSIGSARRTPEGSKKAAKGVGKGIDGIDRGAIDRLSEDKRNARLAGEVWDE